MDTQQSQDIDGYINGFPHGVQEILRRIRAIVRKAAPGAEEAIKYQIPTFVLHGNLVDSTAYKNHIGFYPTSSGIEAFRGEFAGLKWAKGSVQFPLDRKIPYPLIKKMVEFRVKETRAKHATQSGKKKR